MSSLRVFNFLLIILGVHIFSFWCERGWGGCFALLNFECFLFYYFEVSESSIFLLVNLRVFKKLCVKFHKGEEGGICLSSCEFLKFIGFIPFALMDFESFFVLLF